MSEYVIKVEEVDFNERTQWSCSIYKKPISAGIIAFEPHLCNNEEEVDNWVKGNVKDTFFNGGNTAIFNGEKVNDIDEITVLIKKLIR